MPESTVFADLYTGYAGTLINGSTDAADALLNAIAPELAAALSLFVIVNGVLVMVSKLQWNTAILNCVRTVAVANLLTVGLYNQWVEAMFLTKIPGWIMGSTAGGNTGLGIAQQYDKLRSAIDHQAAILWAATTHEWLGAAISDRLSITWAAQWDVAALWLSFFIDFIAQCLMAVVAPVGAVVLLAYLFAYTRKWASAWVGKLVSLSLLELLVAIELKIVMTQFNTYMGKIEAASGSGADMAVLISNFWSVGWAFLFGAVIMVALPAIAAAIGGSHVSNVVTTHITMAGNAANKVMAKATAPVANAAANGAAGAARGAGRAINRSQS